MRANVHSKLVYVTYLRMWVELGLLVLNKVRVNSGVVLSGF